MDYKVKLQFKRAGLIGLGQILAWLDQKMLPYPSCFGLN